jgi:hypothetical protein
MWTRVRADTADVSGPSGYTVHFLREYGDREDNIDLHAGQELQFLPCLRSRKVLQGLAYPTDETDRRKLIICSAYI